MSYLPKILLVEDDRSIAGALAQALRSNYDMDVAGTGKLALYKTDLEDYDAIVLDLNLPDLAGFNVCQQLRERGQTAPILILSGETKVLTKITLLDAGANDYMTKPFSLGEFKARLRSLLRSPARPTYKTRHLIAGELALDRQAFTVSRAGVAINLRRKEFALLECLMENAGKVVSRQLLTRAVWPGNDTLWTNTVEVHINHLRDKLDRPFETKLIRTVHGVGYKLETSSQVVLQD